MQQNTLKTEHIFLRCALMDQPSKLSMSLSQFPRKTTLQKLTLSSAKSVTGENSLIQAPGMTEGALQQCI